jgi:hypothetical protein
LQEGELSSWQVTCRICDPALAFTNQSVKKVVRRAAALLIFRCWQVAD